MFPPSLENVINSFQLGLSILFPFLELKCFSCCGCQFGLTFFQHFIEKVLFVATFMLSLDLWLAKLFPSI